MEIDYEEEKKSPVKKMTSKQKAIILISIAVILLLIFMVNTIFALININNTKIISGVTIDGIEVNKLNREEATQYLNDIVTQKLDNDILIKSDEEFEYEIKLSQIEASYNIEKAVNEAYSVGRNGNIITNNYEIAKAMLFGKDINLEYTYNEELLNNKINDISSKVPNAVVEPNYSVEENELIITKGKAGNTLNEEELKNKIIKELPVTENNLEINVELAQTEPEPIDIDEIYSKVHTEPKDAYYTKNPFQIFPHVNGVDFDLEAAREMLKEDKEEYEIKLTITTPKVTTNQIGTEAFPDLLSSFSTRYDASNYPRTTNLKLAMNKLNGVVVAAGETFSYNNTLGKRTAEAGYKEAGGYAGGRVVQTLAGGICQISSTLYDAVVYANLDIVERHNHMFLAGYVGAGKDATVVYGSLDFKFKNTRKYPIMIKTSIGNGVAKVNIYGIKEEVEYDVDIVTNVLSYTPYKVIYENNSSLAPGQQKVTQNGMNGCKSITYKVLKLNGSEVSRSVLSSDSYDPMNKIINVGPQTTTTTEPTKTETPKEKTPKEPEKTEPSKDKETQKTDKENNNKDPKPTENTGTDKNTTTDKSTGTDSNTITN